MSTYAIGDIHGHYDELIALLDLINYNKDEDTLYLIGDYFDRGHQNREVFDWIADNIDNSNVHFTIGNHEMLMDQAVGGDYLDFSPHSDGYMDDWIFNSGTETYMALREVPDIVRDDVMRKLLKVENYFHQVECNSKIFYIVHAGFPSYKDKNNAYFFDNLIWIREEFYLKPLTPKVKENEYVIIGHTPVRHVWHSLSYNYYDFEQIDFPFENIDDPDKDKKILEFDHKIMIDTGCGHGYALSAYRLDDGKHFSVDCFKSKTFFSE